MSRPDSARAANSGAPGPEVKMRLPGRVGGGPMMPASAKRAPAAVTARKIPLAVPGAIALQSTYNRSLPVALTAAPTWSATAPATEGGTIDRRTSHVLTNCARSATSSMPAWAARLRDSGPRPARQVSTRRPCWCRTVPTPLPISPGLRMPTVSMLTLTMYLTARRHSPCLECARVTTLANQVENALNETRMLILGAQVLLGFQFQAIFQPGFDRLPPELQVLKAVGLGLMLIAVGLLLAPGAFHQIVEHGNDSPRVIEFTSRIATVALLPFALSMGF